MEKIKKIILKTKDFLIEILFPAKCLICNKEGNWICHDCKRKIIFTKKQTCPICFKERKQGKVCPSCRQRTELSSLIVICLYQNNEVIKKLIHALKYKYLQDLKTIIGEILRESFKKDNGNILPKNSIIVPIPLHKKRQRHRGFNQAEIIAQSLAQITRQKLKTKILIRKKFTYPQVKLKAAKRKINVKGAFCLANKLEILNKSVILIDDVYTTGSTMNEAAKVLLKAGAKEVNGLVIARD